MITAGASPPLLLKLVTAHLVGEFLLYPSSRATEVQRGRVLIMHLLVQAGLLALVGWSEPQSLRLWFALTLLLTGHGLTDAWSSRRPVRGIGTLALDQGLHAALICATGLIARSDEFTLLSTGIVHATRDWRSYVLLSGWVIAVPAGAAVVESWIAPFRGKLNDEPAKNLVGLALASRWIGLFERLLVFLAVLFRVELLVGFVVAIKAAFGLRAAEGKPSRVLAEYFLVGSLVSLSWALGVAFVVRWVVQGRP